MLKLNGLLEMMQVMVLNQNEPLHSCCSFSNSKRFENLKESIFNADFFLNQNETQ